MKKSLFFILISFLSLIFLTACGKCEKGYFTAKPGEAIIFVNSGNGENTDATALAEAVTTAIVAVYSESGTSASIGTGVCVSSNGIILTNHHVIEGAKILKVILSNGKNANASVIYKNSNMDIAFLKSDISLPYLPLGDSAETKVGQDVIAVGTPINLNLSHTFTKGIVSALNRTLSSGSPGGYLNNLIQHDASINPGSSGGPLINMQGQVVGINTLKVVSGEGLGFAIPINNFSSLLDNYSQTVSFEVPYIGIVALDAEIACFNGLTEFQQGVYVLNIDELSPSYGVLSAGDVILSVNEISVSNYTEFLKEFYKHHAGEKITIKYNRENNEFNAEIQLNRNKNK